MISPEIFRALGFAGLILVLAIASIWQAAIARTALNDGECDIPGWRTALVLWGGVQGAILTIAIFAGRLI